MDRNPLPNEKRASAKAPAPFFTPTDRPVLLDPFDLFEIEFDRCRAAENRD